MKKLYITLAFLIAVSGGAYYTYTTKNGSSGESYMQLENASPATNRLQNTTEKEVSTNTTEDDVLENGEDVPVAAKTISPAPTSTTSSTQAKTFTIKQVAAHNTKIDCYTAIAGSVYNLTLWINQHPGGDQAILSLCGIDGTSAYDSQHGGQRRPASILTEYKIGTLVN